MPKKQRPPRIGDFLKAGIQSPTLRQVPEFRLPEPIRYNPLEAMRLRGIPASSVIEDDFEKMVIQGKSVLVADLTAIPLKIYTNEDIYDFMNLEEKVTAVKLNQVYIDHENKYFTEDDVKTLLAENKALKLLLEAEKGNSASQRDMKDLARKQRDKVTKQLSEVTQILDYYKKGIDVGIKFNTSCISVKEGIENYIKSQER